MEVLKAVNLSKTYRRGAHLVEALRGASLEIEAGELICILGRSGSGKTTLLNLLAFLDAPTCGSIVFQGKDVDTRALRNLTRIRREYFGFVFQQFNLIPHLSAEENVALPLKYSGVPYNERMKRARALLDRVGLGSRKDFKWDELSGGEAQRVAVARALVNRPAVFFADEPTSELDCETSRELLDLIMDLRNDSNAAMLIVSHDPLVSSYASRVIEMRDGCLFTGL